MYITFYAHHLHISTESYQNRNFLLKWHLRSYKSVVKDFQKKIIPCWKDQRETFNIVIRSIHSQIAKYALFINNRVIFLHHDFDEYSLNHKSQTKIMTRC